MKLSKTLLQENTIKKWKLFEELEKVLYRDAEQSQKKKSIDTFSVSNDPEYSSLESEHTVKKEEIEEVVLIELSEEEIEEVTLMELSEEDSYDLLKTTSEIDSIALHISRTDMNNVYRMRDVELDRLL
eukprot:TRINITY_DN1202_c0_g1_i4.p1 TRINITY_DN1202_c0_g1~~TRINITY_DN1202_c0_g1_i4.p1  ORF type:complete len:128 (+),score=30.80 TRINITY_DN1202_c0_g1_i4:826-1209(+)